MLPGGVKGGLLRPLQGEAELRCRDVLGCLPAVLVQAFGCDEASIKEQRGRGLLHCH